jgi:tellurite resistance protein
MDFFRDLHLTSGQAEVIARGLYAVARAEGGVKPAEASLIKSFYSEVSGGGNLSGLASAPEPSPEALATALGDGPVALLFLKTCLLLSYADGEYHPKERAAVDGFAKALGVSAGQMGELEHSVKEYLLASLAHLDNVEATALVAKKLKL